MTELLHNSLISWKIKSLIKKGNKGRKSINYRNARKVGILFSMDSIYNFETIRSFENKLKKDGKEIVVMSYLPANVENFDFHYDFFTRKDFSFFGEVQADNMKKFLEQPFDLLICLDRNLNVYMEYLLAASAARFRIGPYIKDRENLFELMIRTGEERDLTELINQIYHYTNEL